jgi:protein TonB
MRSFEELFEGTLGEVANPEPPEGFALRLTNRLALSYAEQVTMPLIGRDLVPQGLFASLWSSVRELVSPQRLPALVLESRPIAVVNRMETERSSRSMMGAVLAHAVVILVIGLVVEARTGVVRMVPPMQVVALDAPLPKAPPRSVMSGGGGGQRGPTPVTQGRLPRFAEMQIVPPNAPPLNPPKIAIEPTVEVQTDLRMADNMMPDLGVPNSPIVGRSMGDGTGTGLGPGHGDGVGPGSNGNTGGGLRRVGGSVSEPRVVFQPDAEFSEEARRAKFSGTVQVYLWVDEHGNPTHVRVIQGVGLGLDEKAVEAVRQYKFHPAMQNGKPVTVEMYVDVDFHIM